MEKVKIGEKYWYLYLLYGKIHIDDDIESGDKYDKERAEYGNKFSTRHKAEVMAQKLRAVLKGADVIEMPSEEEFYKVAPLTNKLGGYSLENHRQIQGFQDCWNWIKSKIIK